MKWKVVAKCFLGDQLGRGETFCVKIFSTKIRPCLVTYLKHDGFIMSWCENSMYDH